jgi:hypothetical protein
MDEYWERYQKTQRFEDMLTWLKHSAWLRIEAEQKKLQPIRITVYNYENKFYVPDKMTVDAFCAGGKEGVFAVFRIPSDWNLIGIAYGDDGHWQIAHVYHKHWLKGIAEAINAII